ncbi:histidine kinase [Bacillus aquiflavi]|uniref:Signal transduction histidine-protein kinase/phosphatase DegS n=1 Tax=Bacillus aquiflavi TaxID=2672567 RepID=A0A6B3W333_9BACI|nr:sensor histidine kinase [Bacillus aquiflavi]MBA4538064.1 histidine kinase [Bacillus aquiflavi]NEY82363.1 histidine kinase [Bacillus aquiflavi]UAC47855.1 sensor histidine kinase [Bacillus aquiflavi]
MTLTKFNTKTLDQIIEKMMTEIRKYKDEIFRVSEKGWNDYEFLKEELTHVKERASYIIKDREKLDFQLHFVQKKLSEIGEDVKGCTSEELLNQAQELQRHLKLNRQEEIQLQNRSDEIERQLLELKATIEQAEQFVLRISVVLTYLTNDIKQSGERIKERTHKQEIGLKMIDAQEEERKRLSREIHDGPAQMLANVLLRSDLIERIFRERSPEEAMDEIRSLKKMVRHTLHEVRRIIYDLRPMPLEELGLISTLKKYFQTIEEYYKNIKISFISISNDKRLPIKYELALFRLIQESVQNALKHAYSTEIQVKLTIADGSISIVVNDNGKGFDLNKQQKSQSFGILGMKERVELLNGEISIDTQLDVGTSIRIQVPF